MRVSQQIGWSQESKLIFELIKQTQRLNTLLPGNQPSYNVNVSRQIGWSNESNLYYEWLNELAKVTAHAADCCTTTTTSSTTTTPPLPCNTYVLLQTLGDNYTGVGCDGSSISGTPAEPGITLCAQSINYAGPLYILDSSCNPECMLYLITINLGGGDYTYKNCEGIQIGPVFEPGGETFYVCAEPGTVSGNNIIFTQIGPCKCVEYQINGGFFGGGTYSYIGCDFSYNKNIPIGDGESIIICALAVPTISDLTNMGVGVIGICNP